MVKLKAIKDGLDIISIDGNQYKVDKDNVIEIDAQYVELAVAHGFEIFIEEEKEQIVVTKKGKK